MNDRQWEEFIVKSLKDAGKNISPRRELLAEIIKKAPVTKEEDFRYIRRSREKEAARSTLFSFSLNSWKVFALAGSLAVVAVFLILAQFGSNGPAKIAKSEPSAELIPSADLVQTDAAYAPGAVPAPAADIEKENNNLPLTAEDADELAVAIIAGLSEEDADLSGEADSSLLDDEDAAINDFTQIYAEEQT